MSATIISEQEDIYIDSVTEAIEYIMKVIDRDSDLLYQEKEIIKMFFQFDNYKSITPKDFHNFLNHLQKQKNNEQKKQVSA